MTTRRRKLLLGLAGGSLSLLTLLALAVVLIVRALPPDVVEGTDRPLPDRVVAIPQKSGNVIENIATPVPRTLVHEDANANLGGELWVFDCSASRAYYSDSQH